MKKQQESAAETTTVNEHKGGKIQRLDRDPYLFIDEILMLEEDRELNPRDVNTYTASAEAKDKVKFEEIKASIKESGQIDAISVYYNKALGAWCCAHGWQRLTAMKELKAEGHPIEKVKCNRVSENKQEIAFLHMTANMGVPLREIDRALQIRRLNVVFGVSLTTISKRIGLNYQKVASHASFLEYATEPLVEAIRNGKMKITTAKAIVAETHDSLEINRLLKEGLDAARQKKKEQIAARRNEEAAKAQAKEKGNTVEVAEPATEQPTSEQPALEQPASAQAATVVEAPAKRKAGRPKKEQAAPAPAVEPVEAVAASEPVVEAVVVPLVTADDISDDEVGDVVVQSSDIEPIKTNRLNKLSFESKLVIALKRSADMGDKISQALVNRVASIVERIQNADFASDIHGDNLVSMFRELEESEENTLF